ncbi:MAG: hypothetical protein WDO19_18615 [Bacteroidota bacterium]
MELLNEMKTELKKGNTDDVVYITDDVIHNLEKIIIMANGRIPL